MCKIGLQAADFKITSPVLCDIMFWTVFIPFGTTGFPQLLKNHLNSDLFQDHGKIIEFHEKFLKFVKMEKSLNSEIDIVLTYYMGE